MKDKSKPQAEKKIKVKITFIGPAAQHNLLCWLCEKNPAVYDMNPNWVFRPCWECQKSIKSNKHQQKVKQLGEAIYKLVRGEI